jgi:hypothetical protein
MPSSIDSESIQVEYMLISSITFQNGCFGLIPAFAREPIWTKREISVIQAGHYPFELNPQLQPNQHGIQEFPTIEWNPAPKVCLIAPAIARLECGSIPIGLQNSLDCKLVSWGLFEIKSTEYDMDLNQPKVTLINPNDIFHESISKISYGESIHVLESSQNVFELKFKNALPDMQVCES